MYKYGSSRVGTKHSWYTACKYIKVPVSIWSWQDWWAPGLQESTYWGRWEEASLMLLQWGRSAQSSDPPVSSSWCAPALSLQTKKKELSITSGYTSNYPSHNQVLPLFWICHKKGGSKTNIKHIQYLKNGISKTSRKVSCFYAISQHADKVTHQQPKVILSAEI